MIPAAEIKHTLREAEDLSNAFDELQEGKWLQGELEARKRVRNE